MHEVSLGGVLCDYLTGEARDRTTYEDLRQALARFLAEERGYDPVLLRPRFPVTYVLGAAEFSREADIAVFDPSGNLCALMLFCPGQIHTFQREAASMARLCLPSPCPLAAVTDMKDAELFAARDMQPLARGLAALPDFATLLDMAREYPCPGLPPERRDRESRILHAYTGFLKTCCSENCRPAG